MEDDDKQGDEREDILGILRRYRPWYFLLLVLQIVGWGAVVVCAGNAECLLNGQAERLKGMGQDMSVLVPLWLLMSILLVDLGGYLMVLLPNNRRKLEREAEAKGMAQGIAKGMAQGKAQGIAEGKAQGKAQGIAQGIAEGKAQGIAAGIAQERELRNAELRAIAKKYGIPEEELGIDEED